MDFFCPVCRSAGRSPTRLPASGDIRICPNPACQAEFPVIDGIPIILPNVREWLAGQLWAITCREDLDERLVSLIRDCAGPGGWPDVVASHLSSYAYDHWGEFDLTAPGPPSLAAAALRRGLELFGGSPQGPALDVGCAVGRTTLELAQQLNTAAIGVDVNFALLRLAERAARSGTGQYPLRRGGIVYDNRRFAHPGGPSSLCHFVIADGLRLPFADRAFGVVVALNLLDCVADPVELLRELFRVTQPGGGLIVATPFDWSSTVTPITAWLGGHSQRSLSAGESEVVLRDILTPGRHPASLAGVRIVGHERQPWRVRLHDRATMQYELSLFAVRREGELHLC